MVFAARFETKVASDIAEGAGRKRHRRQAQKESLADASKSKAGIVIASQNGEHMTPALSRAPVAENSLAWSSSDVIGCSRD